MFQVRSAPGERAPFDAGIAAWLTHIPTEVADGVSFRAHEGDTGRRHAKGQASRSACSCERSVSRADHREQAAGPVSRETGGDRGGGLRAGSQRLEDPTTPWPTLQLASASQE